MCDKKAVNCLHYAAYRIFRAVMKPLFLLLFRPVIVDAERIPESGAAVLAGNHKHALDPILIDICTRRVVRTLAKKDLHDGAFGFFFRAVGTIPVDLHAASNPDALRAAVEALKDGSLVNVSPEAKRNYTDELLLPFKYGAAAMSQRSGAPVIPYAITGDYHIFRGKRPTVTFGEPIFCREPDLTSCNRALYEAVGALLQSSADSTFLQSKHYTSFEEWRNRNGKTS